MAGALREATLAVYTRAEAIAREAGIILADTKVEFGEDPRTGELVLGDEVLEQLDNWWEPTSGAAAALDGTDG